MKPRFLSLALACAMLLCVFLLPGGGLAAISADTVPAQDPLGKYDPPIEVTSIHGGNDGAFWFPEGDDITNNIYTRRYEEQLGIKYRFLWTSPGSQANEKMNIMMASGDLPDVLSVGRTDFERLMQAGLLADLTDAVNDYGSLFLKKQISGENEPAQDAVTRDGRMYGVPNVVSYKENSNMLWLRADWLAALNLELPTTLAEFEAICDAFVNQDPDGNGVNDTYAIANYYDEGRYGMQDGFFNMFHAYPGIWVAGQDGQLQDGAFGADQRGNMRTAVQKIAEYTQKGYFHPDYVTIDYTQMQEDLLSDKCGVYFEALWAAYWPLVLHRDSNPTADWVPVQLPSADDVPASTSNEAIAVINICVARKDFEHPEALVKMLNLYHDLNNNPDTMEFNEYNTDPIDNNQIFLSFPLLVYNTTFNYDGYMAIADAMKSGNTDGLCAAYKLFYDQINSYVATGDNSGWAPYRSYTDMGSLKVLSDNVVQKRMMMNEFTGNPTQAIINDLPTVKKAYDQMAAGIFMGGDIAQFDAFLTQYDSLYYEKALAEVNEWYQAKGGNSLQEWFLNN